MLLYGTKYELVDLIEEYIIENELKENDQLLPERELAELFEVNRRTLHRAIECLCAQNKLVSIQGKGTFIAQKKYLVDTVEPTFLQCVNESSLDIRIKELYHKQTELTEELYAEFDSTQQKMVDRKLKLIYINDEPIAYESTYYFDVEKNEKKSELKYKRIKFSLRKADSEDTLLLGLSQHALMVKEVTNVYKDDVLIRSIITRINVSRITFYSVPKC